MDTKEKARRKRRINTLVAEGIHELGFKKTKPNLFVRPHDKLAQFMFLHFYTNLNDIRIHLGHRVFNDPFTSLALNGIHADSGKRNKWTNPETKKNYEFGYNIIDHKEDEAAREVIVFFKEVAYPYFERIRENDWSELPDPVRGFIEEEDSIELFEQSHKILKLKYA